MKNGVDATKGTAASLGRAVYIDESALGQIPEPGAVGLLRILKGHGEGILP